MPLASTEIDDSTFSTSFNNLDLIKKTNNNNCFYYNLNKNYENYKQNNLIQNGCINCKKNECFEQHLTTDDNNKSKEKLKSQKNHSIEKNSQKIVQGVYYGFVKHFDSTLIPVKIEVREVKKSFNI